MSAVDVEPRMEKAFEALTRELAQIRTGKANPGLLDSVHVDYYGSPTPLSQIAAVTAPDARTLLVKPWEKSLIGPVDKAIRAAGLGLNPSAEADQVRVNLPPLTEERRKDLARICRRYGEDARVAVRNIRRDANDNFRKKAKDEGLGQDAEKKALDEIQKITDRFISRIDAVLDEKEREILTV